MQVQTFHRDVHLFSLSLDAFWVVSASSFSSNGMQEQAFHREISKLLGRTPFTHIFYVPWVLAIGMVSESELTEPKNSLILDFGAKARL